MYVCMYVCMYVFMYVCIQACIYAHILRRFVYYLVTSAFVTLIVCVYTASKYEIHIQYTSPCIHMYIYIHIHECTCVYVNVRSLDPVRLRFMRGVFGFTGASVLVCSDL